MRGRRSSRTTTLQQQELQEDVRSYQDSDDDHDDERQTIHSSSQGSSSNNNGLGSRMHDDLLPSSTEESMFTIGDNQDNGNDDDCESIIIDQGQQQLMGNNRSERVLNALDQQHLLYIGPLKEERNVNNTRTIQMNLKRVFRKQQFLSEDGFRFKEPSFVEGDGEKGQAVKICLYLMKQLGMLYRNVCIYITMLID